jgi:iron complex transport system ATP-binding protein
MSAGQQRRIMIGRALVGADDANAAANGAVGSASRAGATTSSSEMLPGGSEMLLLDEPSNALDLSAQQELRVMLRKLAQQGTGILLITHHIADILPEIDRVIQMRDGRIVADGPKVELLRAPVLSGLFGTRVEVTERDGFYYAW